MTAPRTPPHPAFSATCFTDGGHHCVTCADEAVPMEVVGPEADGLAPCADADGRRRTVETTLVGAVAPGESLLVHAGVALAKLHPEEKT